jgi:ankyrin repeat protein
VNAREPQYQQTALMASARKGHTEVVRALVDAGARLEAKDILDGTALNYACNDGHIGAARVLLAAGADVHTRNKTQQTPLINAAAKGHVAMVSMLIQDSEARLVDKDKIGCTALDMACARGHVDVVRALLAARAGVHTRDKQKLTPLMRAAIKGHVAVVRVLVHKAGARLEDKDWEGRTALHYAYAYGQLDTAAALIAAGADVRAKVIDDGQTPRDLACLCLAHVWKGTTAQFLARADATVFFERRRWLLHTRHWLYARERLAAAAGDRLCYGCARARPQAGPTAGLCPRGCGGLKRLVELGGVVYETADAVHDQWFCSAGCYASAAGRHRGVCDQGLRWAAATALQPGVRVVVRGLVAQPRLNGAAGVVVAAGSRAEARRLKAEGRVKVKLDAGGGKPVALKYGNAWMEGSSAE